MSRRVDNECGGIGGMVGRRDERDGIGEMIIHAYTAMANTGWTTNRHGIVVGCSSRCCTSALWHWEPWRRRRGKFPHQTSPERVELLRCKSGQLLNLFT